MSPQLNQSVSDKESMEDPNGIGGQDVSTLLKTADIGTDLSYTHKIMWIKVFVFISQHIAGLTGLYWVFALQVHPLTTIYLITFVLVQFLGITMGVHRYFSHRSFKANTILRRTLLILYVLNGQHSLWTWVRNHRQHHKYSDTDGDPHNATRGLFFSHVGWLMCESHPKVIQYRKGIDTSDIDADPWITFQHKHFYWISFLAMIIPCIFPVVLWNEGVFVAFCVCFGTRILFTVHMTASINSLAHTFGTRPYDKSLRPAQNKLVAFMAYGEGWHNFHHAFPYDYRASELGMTLNWTTNVIDFCAKMGWLYDRKEATDKTIMSRIIRTGDSRESIYGKQIEGKEQNE